MFANHGLVGRTINAIDLVIGYEALDPLNLWAKVVQHAARLLRDRVQLLLREFARSRQFALDHVFRHKKSLRGPVPEHKATSVLSKTASGSSHRLCGEGGLFWIEDPLANSLRTPLRMTVGRRRSFGPGASSCRRSTRNDGFARRCSYADRPKYALASAGKW